MLVILVLFLSGCDFFLLFTDPDYYKVVGTWVVDTTTRPAGWEDTAYVFKGDKTLEIYYGTVLAYKGNVTSCDTQSIMVSATFKKDGGTLDTMKMCYVLSAGDTVMDLGWYDANQSPVYYLDLVKQK